jgi:hypothetical protein
LTIKEILAEEDKSQIFLIALATATPTIIYVVLRVIYDLLMYGRLVIVTGNVFTLALIVQATVIVYLGYWVLMVIRKS